MPTVLDALGQNGVAHRSEGRSLLPLLRGETARAWRDCVFSELDYSYRRARVVLGRRASACRGFMVRTSEWKYVDWQGFRPQLFDVARDSLELNDLGAAAGFERIRSELRERLFEWLAGLSRRTTVSDAQVEARTDAHRRHGVHIGIW